MKFKIGDKVKVKDGLGNVYRVSDVGVYQCEIVKNGSSMGWYNEDDLVPATDPHKATEESAKAADISPYDEPYTLPWEHEYPRNDCNASGGYGAVIKGEKSSDYERGYKEGYEARKNGESKSAQMIVDYDKDLLEAEYKRGLNDAWEAARRISIMTIQEQYRVFNECGDTDIFGCNSASEAIAKLEAIGDKQDEIKVGDEIVYKDGIKGVVVGISNEKGQISLLSNEYNVPQLLIKDNATKTGRHFDAIGEVLKQMKEEE